MADSISKIMIRRAREAYESSTSYFDSNYRQKIGDNLRMHQSRHPAGSKYYKPAYANRSKGFWPKTRAAARQYETKVAKALFSNQDLVSVEPADINNPAQAASAALLKELLNYRLTRSIKWFQIAIAGAQDAFVTGVVCSYQHWIAKERRRIIETTDPFGEPMLTEVAETVEDRPSIELRPINNIRFSPDADFVDPVNSSPYLIDLLPMNIIDVEAKMDEDDASTGEKKWKKYSRGEILRYGQTNKNDQTEQDRRGDLEDPHVTYSDELLDYSTVWIHRNFIRYKDKDYVFYTIGTDKLLTDPKPIEQVYWTGKRPYVIGNVMIESHVPIPDSPVHVGGQLQRELNEIRNTRNDNVLLSMHGRWFVKRGSQVDTRSLVRNAAGSVTKMVDPKGDAVAVKFPEVTSNAYLEQQIVNAGFDEITGAFSSSSVEQNRNMSETVGGMAMLKESGNDLHEYFVLTLVKTWIAPVMEQLVQLEQKYETDEVLMQMSAEKGRLFLRYGESIDLDSLLNQSVTTTVNVGIDATSPESRAGKLLFAFGRISEILQNPVPGIKSEEFIKEIFGAMGYDDGTRFFDYEQAADPMQKQIQDLQQQVEQLSAALNDREADRQLAREISGEDRVAKLEQKRMEIEAKMRAAEMASNDKDAKAGADLNETMLVQEHTDRRKEADIAAKLAIESMKQNEGENKNALLAVSL